MEILWPVDGTTSIRRFHSVREALLLLKWYCLVSCFAEADATQWFSEVRAFYSN